MIILDKFCSVIMYSHLLDCYNYLNDILQGKESSIAETLQVQEAVVEEWLRKFRLKRNFYAGDLQQKEVLKKKGRLI